MNILYLATQRFIFQPHSNLWSTYRLMRGRLSALTCVFFSVFTHFCLPVSISYSLCVCCLAACLRQCTPSSKTKFTACLSLTLSQGMHFIFSHTRGSSSSSSFLWVKQIIVSLSVNERYTCIAFSSQWWMNKRRTCPIFTCLPPPCGQCGHESNVKTMQWVHSAHTPHVPASLCPCVCSSDVWNAKASFHEADPWGAGHRYLPWHCFHPPGHTHHQSAQHLCGETSVCPASGGWDW